MCDDLQHQIEAPVRDTTYAQSIPHLYKPPLSLGGRGYQSTHQGITEKKKKKGWQSPGEGLPTQARRFVRDFPELPRMEHSPYTYELHGQQEK